MTKVLVLFDGAFVPPSTLRGADIDLFPLTNDWSAIGRVRERCAALGAAIRTLEASRLVDTQTSHLRSRVLDWSAQLGDRPVSGIPVRERLLLPGGAVSAWWFSQLFEKNTLKTDVFLRLAQLQAVDELLGSGTYGLVVSALGTRRLGKAVQKAAARQKVRVRRLAPERVRGEGRRKRLEVLGGLGTVLHALGGLGAACRRAWQARRAMGLPQHRPTPLDPVVFVSYFPLVDDAAAAKGEFRNRYAGPLQDLLTEEGRPTVWLLMYVAIQGRSYAQAVDMGRRFAAHGEHVFFLEEFLRPGAVVRVLTAWAALLVKSLGPVGWARGDFLTRGLTIEEGAALLRPLWRQTFTGWPCLSGILSFEMFRNAFAQFPSAGQCLYYVEMQAWEMALNAARRVAAPGVRSVGFQHAGVSRNHFFYFHSPRETRRTGHPADLPWPDVMACNGRKPFEQFERLEYPGLREAEAVRHLHLVPALAAGEPAKPRPPVVLVAGSIDRRETAGLVSLLQEALPRPHGFRIWFKPHPSMPADVVSRVLHGLRAGDACWELRTESAELLLRDSSVVIGGESSLCVDALAYGCHVIAPVLNDTLFMNPLDGHEDFYHRVYGPEELGRVLEALLHGAGRRQTGAEARALVAAFWTLDPSLKRWRAILNS